MRMPGATTWTWSAELRRETVAGRVVTVSEAQQLPGQPSDLALPRPQATPASGDLGLCMAYAPFAQALAMLQSLSLGISPDSPNAAGTVSRVVQGVTIYPWREIP